MQDSRLGFRLLVAAALWVGVAAVGGGLLRAGVGIAVAVGVGWVARSRREPGGPFDGLRAPRQTVAAGLAMLVLGLAWSLGGVGWAGVLTTLLGAGVLAEGARLSLAIEPLADDAPAAEGGIGLVAAVAADEALRFTWDLRDQVGPTGSPELLAERVGGAAARNRERGWLEQPALAHTPPPGLEKPVVTRTELRGAGSALHVAFESEFEPDDAAVRSSYLAVDRNRRAHAMLFRGAAPRPTLICIHGYALGNFAIDTHVFDVPGLRRRLPIDVALYTLPLHGLRARGRRSGAGFLDSDPLWTNAAMAQAIWDLRRLAGWLREEGAPVVGVQGISLGGYTAALLASLDGQLACAVPTVAVASLASFVWDELRAGRRAAFEAAGLTRDLLDDAWATHSPLRQRPAVAHAARLMIAGSADRISPASQTRALWEHWDRPSLHWFPGSHVWMRGRAEVRGALDAHLRRTLCEKSAVPDPVALSRFSFS